MTLDFVKKGEQLEILEIPDPYIRAQAIRLGIYEGAKLNVLKKCRQGPSFCKSNARNRYWTKFKKSMSNRSIILAEEVLQ